MKKIALISLLLCICFSCKKENNKQDALDEQYIKQYLSEHNLTAVKHDSGLYYIMLTEGSGAHPDINSTVTIKYKGYLLNGTVFDQTKDSSTATFSLASLIKSWQIGIPLMKKGGKAIFLTPSSLGYGSNATGNIPANSVLIFEIELVDFE